MKICIEQVQGGFSVYQDDEAAEAQGMGMGMSPGMGQREPGAGDDAAPAAGGQVVATVEEALQLAGSMLGVGGGTDPQQDDESAEALFQSGFKSASKQ